MDKPSLEENIEAQEIIDRQTIKESRNDVLLITIAALLATEFETQINWAAFGENDKFRIAWWIMCLDNNGHDGDCVGGCMTCILCKALDDIKYAEDVIRDAFKISQRKIKRELVNVLLHTPRMVFKTSDDYHKVFSGGGGVPLDFSTPQYNELHKMHFGYEKNIGTRLENYAALKRTDCALYNTLDEKAEHLINFTRDCLNKDPAILDKWWATNDDKLLELGRK
jgi:hypothetical protein